MNKYQMHEVRMWLQNIVIPAVGVAAYVLAQHPEYMDKIKNIVTIEVKKDPNAPLTLIKKFNNPFKKEN